MFYVINQREVEEAFDLARYAVKLSQPPNEPCRTIVLLEWASSARDTKQACDFFATTSYLLDIAILKSRSSTGYIYRFDFKNLFKNGPPWNVDDHALISRFNNVKDHFVRWKDAGIYRNAKRRSDLEKMVFQLMGLKPTKLPPSKDRGIPNKLCSIVHRHDFPIKEVETIDIEEMIKKHDANKPDATENVPMKDRKSWRRYGPYPSLEAVNPAGHGFFE